MALAAANHAGQHDRAPLNTLASIDACRLAEHSDIYRSHDQLLLVEPVLHECLRAHHHPMDVTPFFHASVGQAHAGNRTPHIAVTVAAVLMFVIAAGLEKWILL